MHSSEFVVHASHVLARRRTLPIRDGRETVIHVRFGCVWITQHGDPADRVLGPGECFQLDRDGLAMVQALERSALTLTAPRDDRPGGAFERFWTGLFAPQPRRALPSL